MLRFNIIRQYRRLFNLPFQYILCYGSTDWVTDEVLPTLNFNTSYVTVQPEMVADTLESLKFQYILCYGSTPTIKLPKIKKQVISIHPMLRFND